jgi:hypothetical protein
MVSELDWNPSYRLVGSKYPTVSVYDRISNARNFQSLLEVEALTNPRLREEAGDYRKVRPEDAIAGEGATPIMASFAYSGPSRFSDGTFGVYYAAHELQTAIAESRYWTERFLRATNEPSIDVDKRIYRARVRGSYDDLRARSKRSALYDPDSYERSQAYARSLYERNRVDGIIYNSVRRDGGTCVCAFRPRLISKCRIAGYIQFRWDGNRITAAAKIASFVDV